MNGGSPYPKLDDAVLGSGNALRLYPPQLAVVLAPLTLLPSDLVVWLAFTAAVASLLGALTVLGVRDARCYAAVLVWASTSNALEMTNLSAFLVLAFALAWRYRGSTWPLATTLGLVVSTKLFGWPLLIWAVATRRYRALGAAIGIGVTVTIVAWAVIGFADLTRYPEILRRFSEVQGEAKSYSIVAATVSLGYDPILGQALAGGRRRCAARRVGLLRLVGAGRRALLHHGDRSHARVHARALAPLLRPAGSAARDRPSAVLRDLAPARRFVGMPA